VVVGVVVVVVVIATVDDGCHRLLLLLLLLFLRPLIRIDYACKPAFKELGFSDDALFTF